MAFGSEIRFKIGGDTSALSKAFVQAQSVAATAAQQIRKKFELKDAFKGLMQGIGIGSVDAVANAVLAPFQAAEERARKMASLTGDLLQTTLRTIGAIGGPSRELSIKQQQVRDMTRDIEDQKKLIGELRSNPLTFLREESRALLSQAEDELSNMIKRQAELGAEIQIAVVQENRRTQSLQRQAELQGQLHDAEMRYGSAFEKIQLRKRALQEEYNQLQKQGALPSTLQANLNEQAALEQSRQLLARNIEARIADVKRAMAADEEMMALERKNASEVEKLMARRRNLDRDFDTAKKRGATSDVLLENRRERNQVSNAIKLAQEQSAKQVAEALGAAGSQLAGRAPDRSPRPRPRGRSEAERIADRGRGFALQAEEAARTGRSPNFVGRLTAAAARDFRAVGAKMEQQTAKVDGADANVVGSQLLKTNEILEKIRANLTPTKTAGGSSR